MIEKQSVMRRIVALFMAAFLLILGLPLAVFAASPDDSGAHSVLLYSFSDRTVLWEKNTTSAIAPGATAKMMTALLAIEAFTPAGAARPDLDVSLTLTPELIAGNAYGDTGFVENAVVTRRDLLAALIIGNVNSAANLLARLIDRDVPAFTERMNRRAAELGMTATVYQNPTGLDAEGAVTNARDVLTLALALWKLQDFKDLAARDQIYLSNEKRLFSQNYLVGRWITTKYYYANATGMNAGHTENSGNTLIATAKEEGKEYLVILLGAQNSGDTNLAYGIATAYFRWAPTAFASRTVIRSSQPLGTLPVDEGDGKTVVPFFPEKDCSAILPKDVPEEAITLTWSLDSKRLQAPVEKGATVGTVRAFLDGKEIAACSLVTGSAVQRSKDADRRETAGKIVQGVLLFLLPLTLLALAAYIVFLVRKRRKKSGH